MFGRKHELSDVPMKATAEQLSFRPLQTCGSDEFREPLSPTA
jgi:hypothetical protein